MRSNGILLAGIVLASLTMAGCASNPDTSGSPQQAASTNEAEDQAYCQTDDSTGSRLAPKTTCDSGVNLDAQANARAIQQAGSMGGSTSAMGH
jgi:hypothetical protein